MHIILGFYAACMGLLFTDNIVFHQFVKAMFDDGTPIDRKAYLYYMSIVNTFSHNDQVSVSHLEAYYRNKLGRELIFSDYEDIVEEILSDARYPFKMLPPLQQDTINIIRHIYLRAKRERGFEKTLSINNRRELDKLLPENHKEAISAVIGYYASGLKLKNAMTFISDVRDHENKMFLKKVK